MSQLDKKVVQDKTNYSILAVYKTKLSGSIMFLLRCDISTICTSVTKLTDNKKYNLYLFYTIKIQKVYWNVCWFWVWNMTETSRFHVILLYSMYLSSNRFCRLCKPVHGTTQHVCLSTQHACQFALRCKTILRLPVHVYVVICYCTL